MAWTTPMTAVANDVWTAAQFNTHVRDNLLQTAPAIATSAGEGGLIMAVGTSLFEKVSTGNTTSASDDVTSTTYVATANTIDVTKTVNFGAMVFLGSRLVNDTAGQDTFMALRIIDANTLAEVVAPSDTKAASSRGLAPVRCQAPPIGVNLSAGSYTFQARYRVAGGTGSFVNRWLNVMPF